MSDQCKHCTSRGKLSVCLETPCHIHDSWIFKEYRRIQEQDRERIKREIGKLEAVFDGYEIVISKDEVLDIVGNKGGDDE